MQNYQQTDRQRTPAPRPGTNAPRSTSGARPRTGSTPNRRNTPGSAPAANNAANRRVGDFVKPTDLVRVRGGVDKPMLAIIILLVCFGSVMIFSSSYAFSLQKYGDSYYYIRRQIAYVAIGGSAMTAAMFVDYRIVRRFTGIIFLVSALLLAVVPFIGVGKGLARRWIAVGPITIQPSEIMKFALVIFLAWYISKYQYMITDYSDRNRASRYGVFYPMAVVAVICLAIAVENHLSCVIIVFTLGALIAFVGGGLKRWFIAAIVIGVLGVLVILFVAPYTMERINQWLHPENYTPTGEIYQTLQALDAIGSGGVFGKGLGNSAQKHLYIAEPMNDFIFSIICEELGLIGAGAVVIIFGLFIWRGIHIARRAPDTFSSLVAFGLTSKVAIQAILNMMVVTSMIPNTGVSLPFISYGGTALLMQMGEMGILLSISRYSYVEAKPKAQPSTDASVSRERR